MKKFFLLIGVLSLLPAAVLALDCPYGQVNDPAPGDCRLYRDINDNGYCDLSEVQPIAAETKAESQPAISQAQTPVTKAQSHYFVLITLIMLLGYAGGLLAVRTGKLGLAAHRKIWNWLLLALFVPTALTSLFLGLMIEYGWYLDLGISYNYWHLVFGWAFLLASLFHTSWHLCYYRVVKK